MIAWLWMLQALFLLLCKNYINRPGNRDAALELFQNNSTDRVFLEHHFDPRIFTVWPKRIFLALVCADVNLSPILEQLLHKCFLLNSYSFNHPTPPRDRRKRRKFTAWGNCGQTIPKGICINEESLLQFIFSLPPFRENFQIRKCLLDCFHCLAARLVTDSTTSLANPLPN